MGGTNSCKGTINGAQHKKLCPINIIPIVFFSALYARYDRSPLHLHPLPTALIQL